MELTGAPNKRALCDALKADIIVLPLPAEKNGYLSGTELTMESLLRSLRREHRIFAGNVGNDASTLAQALGLTITDYFASEELSVRNAIPTAEGAIEAAMKHTSVTLHGTPCLVLGFGRIGKVLAHDLSALGAKVSVSARKRSDLAWIDAFGYAPLHTNRLSGTLGNSAWCSTPCRIRYWTKRSLPSCRRTACSSSLRARAALTWTRSKRCAFRISRQGTARARRAGDGGAGHQKDVMSTHQGGSMKIGFAFAARFATIPSC